MTRYWYCFIVKPQQEREVVEALQRVFGFKRGDIWLPRQGVTTRRNNRSKRTMVRWQPISGYIFVRHHMAPDWHRVSGHKSFICMMRDSVGEDECETPPPLVVSDALIRLTRLAIINDFRKQQKGRKPRAPLGFGSRIHVTEDVQGTVQERVNAGAARVVLDAMLLGKKEITMKYEHMRAA